MKALLSGDFNRALENIAVQKCLIPASVACRLTSLGHCHPHEATNTYSQSLTAPVAGLRHCHSQRPPQSSVAMHLSMDGHSVLDSQHN